MSRGAGVLLGAARAGIEFSWRFAWASFLMLAIASRGFPPMVAAAALAASAFLRGLAARRGWRRLPALLAQLAAFAACALAVLHRLWPEGLPPWYSLLASGACLWLLWNGGRAAAREPEDPVPLDRGIGLFLLLQIIRLVAATKGVVLPEAPATEWLLAALFASGLAAVGLARAGGQEPPRAGRGTRLLLGTALAGVLLACGLALRGYAPLTAVADSLLPLLGAAARPAGRAVSGLLVFLFSPKNLRGAGLEAQGAERSGSGILPPAGALTPIRVIGLGLTVLVGLLGVALLGLLLLQLARWLLRWLGGGTPRRRVPRLRLAGLLGALLSLPAHLCRGLGAWLRGRNRAATVYGALLRWGSRSGLPHAASETPAEYGARVARSLPRLALEIGLIVEGFNLEAYGRRLTAPEALSRLRGARRRLLSPRHWPARLRVLLLRPPGLPSRGDPGYS